MSKNQPFKRVYSHSHTERVGMSLRETNLVLGGRRPNAVSLKRAANIQAGNKISEAAAKRKPFLS